MHMQLLWYVLLPFSHPQWPSNTSARTHAWCCAQVVRQWAQTFGAVYSTLDADSQYVLVSDNANNRAVILQPAGGWYMLGSTRVAAAHMPLLQSGRKHRLGCRGSSIACRVPCSAAPGNSIGCWLTSVRPVLCAATGKASTIKYTVPVAGNPGHPIFYPKNAADNETTFSVCMYPCICCI